MRKLKRKIKKVLHLTKEQRNAFGYFKKNTSLDFYDLKCLIFKSSTTSKIQKIASKFDRNLVITIGETNNFKDSKKYSSSYVPPSNAELYLFDFKSSNKIVDPNVQSNFVGIPFRAFFFKPVTILRFFLKGKYVIAGLKSLNGSYLIFLRTKFQNSNDKARRYIPYTYSRTSLLQHLKESNINATILRWFEKLNEFEGNIKEDIDVLIADDHLDTLGAILDENVGIFPIDVYSAGGLPNSAFANVPYYPYQLSNRILENKKTSLDGFYIPSDNDYVTSLCYHAVFHKSMQSGIPIDSQENFKLDTNIDHNYYSILQNVFNRLGIEQEDMSLKGLFHFLEDKKAVPSYDLILKLSKIKNNDAWYTYLKKYFESEITTQYSHIKGLSVFLIRSVAFKEMDLDKTRAIFESFGFDIITEASIPENRLDSVKNEIRGGNWTKGPYQISGGFPVYYFVAYDPFYVTPEKKQLENFPNLENRKITHLKNELRALFRRKIKQTFNGVHSSDNFYESIDYLQHLIENKDQIHNILDQCSEIKKQYQSDHKIVRDLSRNSSRAKVALIEYEGGLAIQKTYKKGQERFLQREIQFMKTFSSHSSIPNLLEESPSYFISEYFENASSLQIPEKLVTPSVVIQFKNLLQQIYDKNMTLLDVNPSNVLIVNGQLKLIDFEFATLYENRPDSLGEAYELKQIPIGFKGDIPKGHATIEDAYDLFWRKRLRLTKRQFLTISNRTLLSALMKFNYVKFRLFP